MKIALLACAGLLLVSLGCHRKTDQREYRRTNHVRAQLVSHGLPVLAIRCGNEGQIIGTAFVVRAADRPGAVAYAITAAHVLERDAAICGPKGLELQGRPYEGDLNVPCRYPAPLPSRDWPMKVAGPSFPLDIASILLQPPTDDGKCRLRTSVHVLLALPNEVTPMQYHLLNHQGTGTLGVDLANPSYIDVKASDITEDSLDGLDFEVSSAKPIRVGAGYSGSPVLFFDSRNQFRSPALVTDQAAIIGSEEAPEAVPDIYSVRLIDTIALPPKAADAVMDLVPPSTAASAIIAQMQNCKIPDDETLTSNQLDGFDELHLLKAGTDQSRTCDARIRSQQLSGLRNRLRNEYSSSIFQWPSMSNSVVSDVGPVALGKMRGNCTAGRFSDPRYGLDVWQLQAMALGMHYKLFGSQYGDDQAFTFVRDKAKCQSWLTSSYKRPVAMLRNLWLEDTLGKLQASSLRFYADLFKDMVDRESVVDQGYGQPSKSERARIAALAFRLYELCYRTQRCTVTFGDVASAARLLDKLTDGSIKEGLKTNLPFERALSRRLACFAESPERRAWASFYDDDDSNDDRVLRNLERRIRAIATVKLFSATYEKCKVV